MASQAEKWLGALKLHFPQPWSCGHKEQKGGRWKDLEIYGLDGKRVRGVN